MTLEYVLTLVCGVLLLWRSKPVTQYLMALRIDPYWFVPSRSRERFAAFENKLQRGLIISFAVGMVVYSIAGLLGLFS